MIESTPYYLGFWWLSVLSIFFVKEINKKYIFLLLSTLLIFLLPVGSYIMSQRSFNSESLPRYSAIVMYLFPLVVGFIDIKEDKLRKIAAYGVFGLVFLFVFLNSMYPMPLIEKFTLSKGTYQSELAKYNQFAVSILDLTGPDSRVLIADDLASGITTNTLIPDIFVRYYMLNNSVGAQYKIATEDISTYADQYHTDYILLLSYADSFENCEGVFTADRDYLIDIRDGELSSDPGSCEFSTVEIIDLGEAIR